MDTEGVLVPCLKSSVIEVDNLSSKFMILARPGYYMSYCGRGLTNENNGGKNETLPDSG